MSGEAEHSVSKPLPDVCIQQMQTGNSKDIIFFIRNDDPECSITSTMVKCDIEGDIVKEVLIGYFPGLPGEEALCYWVIGAQNRMPEYKDLHQWLGVTNRQDSIPYIDFAYMQDSDFERGWVDYENNNPPEPWQTPFLQKSAAEKAELRGQWIENISRAFCERFQKLGLSPECQRKTEAILQEIFERIDKRQKIIVSTPHMRGVLDDPERGFRRFEEE